MVVAYLPTEEVNGASLYLLCPAQATLNNTQELTRLVTLCLGVVLGENRSARICSHQRRASGRALYHLATLAITFAVSATSGLNVVGEVFGKSFIFLRRKNL